MTYHRKIASEKRLSPSHKSVDHIGVEPEFILFVVLHTVQLVAMPVNVVLKPILSLEVGSILFVRDGP